MTREQLLKDYARALKSIRDRYREEGDGINSGPVEINGDDEFLDPADKKWKPIPEIAALLDYIEKAADPRGV